MRPTACGGFAPPGHAALLLLCRPDGLRGVAPGPAARAAACGRRCGAARGDPPRPRSLALLRRGAPQGLGPPARPRWHPRRPGPGAPPHARECFALAAPRPAEASQRPRRTHHHHAPGVMWGTDAAVIPTVEDGNITLFVVVEHWNAEALGWHVAEKADRFAAAQALDLAIHTACGAVRADAARGLLLRHDHGSAFMSDHFQNQITFLGMTPSFAFVREPETNGVAERFIRTLKEQVVWGRIFRNAEEVRAAVRAFV